MLLRGVCALVVLISSKETVGLPENLAQLQEGPQDLPLTPLVTVTKANSKSLKQILDLLHQLQAKQQLLHQQQNQLQLGQLGLVSALHLHGNAIHCEYDALAERYGDSTSRTGRLLKEDPACDPYPQPLPLSDESHQEPQVRACAKSCLQLRDQSSSSKDGVYWLTDLPVPVFCDMSHDGGGWTLLLTAVSKQGWDVLAALERNAFSPSLTNNYAILKYADGIRDLGNGTRFAYRIETQAETGRGQWGGVWLAPRNYSFVHGDYYQVDVLLIRRFNKWNYQEHGIQQRMPWLNYADQSNHPAVLTMRSTGDYWWGTLVTQEWEPNYDHSPWINPESIRSGTVLYWLREEAA